MPPKKTAAKAQPAPKKATVKKAVKKVVPVEEVEEEDDKMEDDEEAEDADTGMDDAGNEEEEEVVANEEEEKEDEEEEEEEEEEAAPAPAKSKAKNGLQVKANEAQEEEDEEDEVEEVDAEEEEEQEEEEEEEQEEEEQEEQEEEQEDQEEDEEAEGDSPKKPAKKAAASKDKKAAKSGKRKAANDEESAGGSDAKKLKLEDYVPESCIDSQEKRDSCSLVITMARGARPGDITELSGDIINLVIKGEKAFARYVDADTAAANLKLLEKEAGNGKLTRVEKCTSHETETQDNLLDVFRVPFECTVSRLKELFPGAKVYVLNDGFARLHFDSSEDLLNAVQNPACHTIDGSTIRFSLVKKFGQGGGFRGGNQSRGGNSRGGRVLLLKGPVSAAWTARCMVKIRHQGQPPHHHNHRTHHICD